MSETSRYPRGFDPQEPTEFVPRVNHMAADNPSSESSDTIASQNKSLAGLARKFADSFGCKFEIWKLEEAKKYLALYSVDAEDQAALTEHKCPIVKQMLPGEHLLFIPLSNFGFPTAIATGFIVAENPTVYLNLAHSMVERNNQIAELSDQGLENEFLVRQVSEDLEELVFLRQIAGMLSQKAHTGNIREMAGPVFEMINFSVKAESLVLLTVDKSNSEEFVEAARHGQPDISIGEIHQLISQYQPSREQPEVVNHWGSIIGGEQGGAIRSFVFVPVATDYFHGWILALNRLADDGPATIWNRNRDEFGSSEATLLHSSATMLAAFMTNMDMIVEREKLLIDVVRTLVSAIEARDKYTCGHSERVALYGRKLGQLLGFDETGMERVFLSGLLHDIGKIGIPDSVLLKPGKLDDCEFDLIKQHPKDGWLIIKDLKQIHHLRDGILYHHEEVNGTGYPEGLVGDSIPIDGRILSIADAFDAMTSDRPYRNGMPTEKAAGIIRDGAGTQWDAHLVAVFLENLKDFELIKDTYSAAESDGQAAPSALAETKN